LTLSWTEGVPFITPKINIPNVPCNIGGGGQPGSCIPSAPRAPRFFSSPSRGQEHTHTRKKLLALSLARSQSRPLDSLSVQLQRPAAAAVPFPLLHQALPPADPNWNLGLRLHTTNPVNTRAITPPESYFLAASEFLALFSLARKLLCWER
jgi:hypothetical protein